MNKADIINVMSVRYGCTQKEAARQLDQILDVITYGIKKDGVVKLRGFGTFNVVERQAKTIINPKTKERTYIPKRKVVTLNPSEKLKKAIQNGGDIHE